MKRLTVSKLTLDLENMFYSLNKDEKDRFLNSLDFYLDMKEEVEWGSNVKRGDICLFDFGLLQKRECAYPHVALVLKRSNTKLFVVPMTSKQDRVEEGKQFGETWTSHILTHHFDGLEKPSALFLDDGKWISQSRFIEKKGQIDTSSEIFKWIRNEAIELIF